MNEAVIDAGAVLDERDRGRGEAAETSGGKEVDGARGRAALAGGRRRWPVGARTFFVVTGLAMAGIVVMLLTRAHRVRQESEARRRGGPGATERIEKRVPELKLAAPAAGTPRSGRLVAARVDPADPGAAAALGQRTV